MVSKESKWIEKVKPSCLLFANTFSSDKITQQHGQLNNCLLFSFYIKDDSLSRSFSSNLSLAPQRPRSASLHSHQLSPSLQGLKRTFGRPSLSRSRPSSARFSSSKGSRFSSPSMEQENKAMTGKVEAGFAAVKKQLVREKRFSKWHVA